jgi:hypothetical protein
MLSLLLKLPRKLLKQKRLARRKNGNLNTVRVVSG